MLDHEEFDPTDILNGGRLVDAALRRGVVEALIRHKRLGEPIVEYIDGEVVLTPAEEIPDFAEELWQLNELLGDEGRGPLS
ncbi:hypothetical protein Pan216_16640 [Planctomycetes bacterium Pan216]|uniref:Uncharacterized protein n=1 Tax=Kolteria novifilia TaxID=2527975 RepID=A0A518B1I5_9BACT|nr:hypothetical protein Pan216_16640 [Planctomycetes bacterium Pan216]